MKSAGIKVGKDNLYQLLEYIQDCYLLFLVNTFSPSLNIQKFNDKKIYCIDNGMVNYIATRFSEDKGRLLENSVYLFLRASGFEIYYFKKKRECDFIVYKNNKLTGAIQVAYELNERNREREIQGLTEAMNSLNINRGIILTFDKSDTAEIDKKKIKILPVWKWYLSPEF